MVQISYSQPIIKKSNEIKPSAFSNQSYPYNQISSDRRFEELLYSIAKLHLGTGIFTNYDSVSLMSGVSERGRDCALFKNGKSNGVIQCKKYDRNLSKEEFGKEITKFVLYSLLENKILPDPETFTYYIAVSRGYVRDCSDFIDDFNHDILTEPKLIKWVNFNIKKYVSLHHLQLNTTEIYQKVKNILTQISVWKITPQELDIYLSTPKSVNLTSLFFEVRTVVDNSALNTFKDEIIQLLPRKAPDNLKLQKELDRGSISLKSERNEFPEIPDSHIPRLETDKLYNWIKSDPKKK